MGRFSVYIASSKNLFRLLRYNADRNAGPFQARRLSWVTLKTISRQLRTRI